MSMLKKTFFDVVNFFSRKPDVKSVVIFSAKTRTFFEVKAVFSAEELFGNVEVPEEYRDSVIIEIEEN